MFAKRLSELTAGDIEAFVAEEPPEGDQLELKKALQSKKGEDRWVTHGDRIGERARDELIAEIIAFANAHGGTLLLGVDEMKTKPARASEITPVPNCIELADRLRLQCRDCIEPQLAVIEVEGVPTGEDGGGVVVFRVLPSRMAAHRHTSTKECYIRRADRTEKMTMREIQDLTLQVERGNSTIEKAFAKRRDNFKESVAEYFGRGEVVKLGDVRRGVAIRFSLAPLSPIYIEKVHGTIPIQPRLEQFVGRLGGSDRKYDLVASHSHLNWRPILRGSSASDEAEDRYRVNVEVTCDGQLNYEMLRMDHEERGNRVYMGWIMALLANAVIAGERFRVAAGAPGVEYGLDMEIWAVGGECSVLSYGSGSLYEGAYGAFPGGQTRFPQYSIGLPEEFPLIVRAVERDLWNAAGRDWDDGIVIDFSSALGE